MSTWDRGCVCHWVPPMTHILHYIQLHGHAYGMEWLMACPLILSVLGNSRVAKLA
jgi:hypothetical protein